MNYRLGELFCGPGGLALGAHNAQVWKDGVEYRITHAWANDIHKDTCATYAENICQGEYSSVVCADVNNVEVDALAQISHIDGLAFGFPCNDFSMVGEQQGINGKFGPLYTHGVRMLDHFRPQFFVAENVGGLNSANEGRALKQILDDLLNAGYSLFPHLYKFEDYGVPQARHRLIIVGLRCDLGLTFNIPATKMYGRMSAKEAIENPPIPNHASNNELTRQSKSVVDRLSFIKAGQNAFNAELPDHLRLNVKSVTMSQIYRRLDPDKPSYTVTGSGGGGTHVYHWSENRALTNRERARLQTFPDSFRFCGSKESVRRQIGMAVPPSGAKIIFEALIKTLIGVDYESEPSSMKPILHS